MSVSRPLSVGEHNAIAHALFLRQESLTKQAHKYRVMAMSLAAKFGDENNEVRRGAEYADKMQEEAKAVFNLELLVRRYTLELISPIHIPEQI